MTHILLGGFAPFASSRAEKLFRLIKKGQVSFEDVRVLPLYTRAVYCDGCVLPSGTFCVVSGFVATVVSEGQLFRWDYVRNNARLKGLTHQRSAVELLVLAITDTVFAVVPASSLASRAIDDPCALF